MEPLVVLRVGLKVAVPVMSKGPETTPLGAVTLTVGVLSSVSDTLDDALPVQSEAIALYACVPWSPPRSSMLVQEAAPFPPAEQSVSQLSRCSVMLPLLTVWLLVQYPVASLASQTTQLAKLPFAVAATPPSGWGVAATEAEPANARRGTQPR